MATKHIHIHVGKKRTVDADPNAEAKRALAAAKIKVKEAENLLRAVADDVNQPDLRKSVHMSLDNIRSALRYM